MRETGGAIVPTASCGVELRGDGRGEPAYISSKAAIRGLTGSLGEYNIRVNAVSPGATETPMIGNYDNVARDTAIGRTPIGRIALPEDIADIARFLISEEARFMTGQIVTVTGGSAFRVTVTLKETVGIDIDLHPNRVRWPDGCEPRLQAILYTDRPCRAHQQSAAMTTPKECQGRRSGAQHLKISCLRGAARQAPGNLIHI